MKKHFEVLQGFQLELKRAEAIMCRQQQLGSESPESKKSNLDSVVMTDELKVLALKVRFD